MGEGAKKCVRGGGGQGSVYVGEGGKEVCMSVRGARNRLVYKPITLLSNSHKACILS